MQAILFDVDGTLIDSVDYHARSWQRVFQEHGRSIPFDAIRSQIGKGWDQLLRVFLREEEVEESGEALAARHGELFEQTYFPLLRAFPGVRQLFERLRGNGLRIGLATSSSNAHLRFFKAIADIEDLVDVEVCVDDIDRSKPNPEVFVLCMNKLGVEARDALAVGDTPYDAKAATAAGIRTIGLLCGGFPEVQLRIAGCFAVFEDPADMLRHCGGIFETQRLPRTSKVMGQFIRDAYAARARGHDLIPV